MSEEILKALMQLFAIVTKQGGSAMNEQRFHVEAFLKFQLPNDKVQDYLSIYEGFLMFDAGREGGVGAKQVSVKDSVYTLKICKKINKTLSQKQKVIVLLHLLNLIKKDSSALDSNLSIIGTMASVFNILPHDFKLLEGFIVGNDVVAGTPDLLLLEGRDGATSPVSADKDVPQHCLAVLRIKSVNLFLFKPVGGISIRWNGSILSDQTVRVFASGGMIQISENKPVYYQTILSFFAPDNAFAPLSFNVNKISYSFPNGNSGLEELSLSEGPGRLIGIMGSSGSGKTTLLNIMSGLLKPEKGNILLNGIDIYKNSKLVKGSIGLVPQDDLLVEDITVYENLYFNARFCFADKDAREIQRLVLTILDLLGLADKAHLKVGDVLNKVISGGQRKRLNIALELIREPQVLFLDEPTSGLSSKDSESLINLLKQLTLKGKLIFVVIHQPSSDIFKLFDSIVLMDRNGYLIYNGNPIEAVVYFKTMEHLVNHELGECETCGNINPESIFTTVEAEVLDEYGESSGVRKVAPKEWSQSFKSHFVLEQKADVAEKPLNSLKSPSRIEQLYIYLKRDVLSKFSNKQYLIVNALETPVLAFILSFLIRYINAPEGYIFSENDNIPAYIFMSIIVFSFMGISVSAEEIFRDSKIRKREQFLNLSRSAYLLSKIVLLFTLSAVQAAIYILIANSIVGINDLFVSYWLVFFTVSCCSNLIGLNISAAFDSIVTIYILIPILIIPQMILGGAMFSYEKLNPLIGGGYKVPFVAEFNPSRWAYEALMVAQFKNNSFEKQFYELEKTESICNYKRGPYLAHLSKMANEIYAAKASSNAGEKEKAAKRLALLKSEIANEIKVIPTISCIPIQNLTVPNLQKQDLDSIARYFDKLTERYNQKLARVIERKEMMLYQFQKDNQARLNFRKFKSAYYNEYLSDVVTKKYSLKKLIEYENEIVQIVDPIFRAPSKASWLNFRTLFFSPQKTVFNRFFNTFDFNLAILWLNILILYVCLYFDIPRKIINVGKQ